MPTDTQSPEDLEQPPKTPLDGAPASPEEEKTPEGQVQAHDPSGDPPTPPLPAPDATAEREARCVPVAKEIVKLIGSFDQGMIGEATTTQAQEYVNSYFELVKQIMELLLARNVIIDEIPYIMSLVMMPFDYATNLLKNSMQANVARLEVKTFGKQLGELGMADVDKFLGATPSEEKEKVV